jgi:hypothetical protein
MARLELKLLQNLTELAILAYSNSLAVVDATNILVNGGPRSRKSNGSFEISES